MIRKFSEVPANLFLGFELVKSGDGNSELTMPVRKEFLQEGGVVHGGIISALADTAAVYALLPTLPASQKMTSIEFKMNFLRPARFGESLTAIARTLKQGRKVSVAEVVVMQKGKEVAVGTFTYLNFH